MEDADSKSLNGRRWARNAIAELTTAINEASSVIMSDDDAVALGYVGNVRIAVAKASDYLVRSAVALEDAKELRRVEKQRQEG